MIMRSWGALAGRRLGSFDPETRQDKMQDAQLHDDNQYETDTSTAPAPYHPRGDWRVTGFTEQEAEAVRKVLRANRITKAIYHPPPVKNTHSWTG